METMETESPTENITREDPITNKNFTRDDPAIDLDDLSPVEEVRLTAPVTDDPTLPVWTFPSPVQVASLPIGRFLASVLPTTSFHVPEFGSREFSLNPGPFNMKEHVLITIFANAGNAFGNGSAALHEKEVDDRKHGISRVKFFVIALICTFCWHLFPGYLFQSLQSISWVCWAFPKSVTAHQIGSGLNGLGIGAFTLDWTAVASFFAKTFPLFSPELYTAQGPEYNVTLIVNKNFELDEASYKQLGRIHLSTFFALTYGFGFATIASTLSHVALFYGREIYDRSRASTTRRQDIHTRLMQRYRGLPLWWFYALLGVTVAISLALFTSLRKEVQMPWWGVIFAAGLAFIFTLPVSIITATTNQIPGLNIITEYIMGVIQPGKPITNVCFKTYGYMSMTQAIAFLSDFKLGHYMKIPPRSMFLVQLIGTILAGTINLGVAWWLLDSVDHICQKGLLPQNSPWTCPNDRVFFDAPVIWGLVGPKRIFGSQGNYGALNWFFLGGFLGPIVVWLLHRAFPRQHWIPLINLPVLLGATAYMPPATALNYNSWIVVGTIFNFFIFSSSLHLTGFGGHKLALVGALTQLLTPGTVTSQLAPPQRQHSQLQFPLLRTKNLTTPKRHYCCHSQITMPSLKTETNPLNTTKPSPEEGPQPMDEHDDISPIEEVRLTVSNVDDPTLPVFTFRMWLLGVVSCVLLSFLNTFFAYRTQPLIISMISVQVASLPIGRFMAKVLPEKKFRIPGFGGREWTLNPGPFNMKEHVLISVFANAGSAFGGGAAYAVSIVNIIKAFYNRNISFLASWILVITTQVRILRKFVVDPPEMWWPSSLVQVSLFRVLHEKDDKRMSRGKFFVIALICSFSWYLFPGYLFPTLSSISWVCWAFPNSVTAQQLGSGMRGLGLGSFALDWKIYQQIRASSTGKQDIHTRLMMKYEPTPSWWFHSMLVGSLVLSLVLCIFMKDEIQMPWWGLIFASALALLFTLPISIITATTNMTPGLNVITEYVMGIIYPGRPIANVCFKTYGYISMGQAVSFLSDFKLGHYMKIPTRAMFIVQLVGTIIAGTVNIGVAWWLLTTVENICQDQLLSPNSPWTCPGDRVFFDASVIWGLVGPKRIFGKSGNYPALNWFFLGGALGPVIVWMLHRAFPNQKWIPLINLPVLLGATAAMPPATTLNFNCWMIVGTIFNHFIFKYRKGWWQRYNYVLSAALDAGLAFMGVLLYFTLTMENRSITWWGSDGEHCELATCPTAKGIVVEGLSGVVVV
ncbi:hypothetical protein Patl1_08709 [Pistacia atlantica]|uniref:Uncharacterized protein n=1 Tax=Pistacia atlantica TaxID=434234 RepID=A0ACC1AIT7_9ROSI|nr:hypothetical protein Patl1_08709 [Pistacia atlantica]